MRIKSFKITVQDVTPLLAETDAQIDMDGLLERFDQFIEFDGDPADHEFCLLQVDDTSYLIYATKEEVARQLRKHLL